MKYNVYKEILKIEKDLDKNFKNSNNISLLSGVGGLPIFYFLLHKLTDKDQYKVKSNKIIEKIFKNLNEFNINNSHCTGLSGIGFMLNYLANHKFLEEDIEESLKVIDDVLSAYIFNSVTIKKDLDFLHGGLGMAYYLLKRYADNDNLDINIVGVFEKVSSIIIDDIEKNRNWRLSSGNIENADFVVNCGFAHGLGSNIVVLSNFIKIFPENRIVRKALINSIEEILFFSSFDDRHISVFPGIVKTKSTASYNMALSWCYGDQAIAYALHRASDVFERDKLLSISKKIFNKTLQRDTLEKSVNSMGICDSSFCHGIVSIGYLHKKAFLATDNSEFLTLYEKLIARLIAKAGSSEGYNWYDRKYGFRKDYTFLNGLIGVGVFYIDYLLNDNSLKWESVFLLD